MQTCDVLIVGGGPAGSSCAWSLRRAGADVLVMDRAMFPRDKVCAGWITPQVVADLELDVDDYRRGRTFQPITGFRTGLIGRAGDIETTYGDAVSYGIRRCEFDQYLLQRSGARLALAMPVSSFRRDGAHWIVNGSVRTSLIVGAGGHFCPVARWLNPASPSLPIVVAQESEFPIDRMEAAAWAVVPEAPELYFSPDLNGYGWCFRKGEYINIGIGRLDRRSLPKAASEFVAFLRARRRIPPSGRWSWRGHAYLVSDPPRRRAVDAGVLLVGDAAGLAYPKSGEGIRPAIESGLLAASTIVRAGGSYARDRLEPYERELAARFGIRQAAGLPLMRAARARLASRLAPPLFRSRWFVRTRLLDRWFLRATEPALIAGAASAAS